MQRRPVRPLNGHKVHMEWPFTYPDPAGESGSVSGPDASRVPTDAPAGDSQSAPPPKADGAAPVVAPAVERGPRILIPWGRFPSFRVVAFCGMMLLSIIPWFLPLGASYRTPGPPRVTLRAVDARLDRIEAELMAILRKVGGSEADSFPLPPWLVKDRK